MSEKKQYSLLTEKDIEQGLNNGVFKKENIELVRDEEGKIVKHIKMTAIKSSIIPPTLIQINNQIIYQADIKPIIDAIIETRNTEIFEDLDEKYQIVLDSLEYYKNYNERLDELNSKSLDVSSVFEKRTDKYINNINLEELSNIDRVQFINMLDSYTNIIFVYMISTYWLHNEKVSKDTAIMRKLENLYKSVRHIFEQILAKSHKDEEGTNIIPMNHSLYAKYLLAAKNGVSHIEQLIKHDSRFISLTAFMNFINRCCFVKDEKYWDDYRGWIEPESYSINIRVDNDSLEDDIRHPLIHDLFDILEKIDILRSIFTELKNANKIDVNNIKLYDEENGKANKALHLTAIPLALHSGR